MTNRVDLNAYLDRIDYRGPRTAGLSLLAELQRRHIATIPFENLSPFLGLEVELSPPGLERKLIHQHRGGYCYEHNLLFKNILEQLGFQVSGLGARVLWEQPYTARPAVSHMLLRVTLDEVDYLVDTGFGALTPTAPLRLDRVGPQETAHEPYRVLHLNDHFLLEAYAGNGWKTLYRFDLRELWQADYEMASWYLSHHPQSHFVTNLVACRADTDGRRNLNNQRLSIYPPGGERQRRTLSSVAEVLAVLEQEIGLRLPDHPALERRVADLLAAGAG